MQPAWSDACGGGDAACDCLRDGAGTLTRWHPPPTQAGAAEPMSVSEPPEADAAAEGTREEAAQAEQSAMRIEALTRAIGSLALLKEPAPPTPSVLLVLDVNGLLVHRSREKLRGLDASLVHKRTWVYDRPHSDDFLTWVLQRFTVGVWSSARADNLEPLVAHVFGAERRRCLRFTWSQEQCSTDGTVHTKCGRGRTASKPRFLKELARLAAAGHGTLTHTLLVDDDHYKAARNPPHTAVHPRAFEAAAGSVDAGLSATAPLRLFLEQLLSRSPMTVPEFVESHPFVD